MNKCLEEGKVSKSVSVDYIAFNRRMMISWSAEPELPNSW